MIESMLNELRQEAATTKRVLDRVPPGALSWRPHEKSMSAGQLALHVATIPGAITQLARLDVFDAAQANFTPDQPNHVDEILAASESALASAAEYLSDQNKETAAQSWCLTANGREVMKLPKSELLRNYLFNHWYHHRGQLSVYLRLLNVPVPVIYGRSADEDPFA